MSQKLLTGLTATLLITAFGAPASSNATPKPASSSSISETSLETPVQNLPEPSSKPPVAQANASSEPTEVVKIGEQQSPTAQKQADDSIAKVQAHTLDGRQAVTLYVRNIPVLTFVGTPSSDSQAVKLGTEASEAATTQASASADKSYSTIATSSEAQEADRTDAPEADKVSEQSETDPLWRASSLATKINQLNREGIDASKISVSWSATAKTAGAGDRYVIKVDENVLATIDAATILPDTTRNLEQDALQATNRLRRLLGNASPLNQVSGKPKIVNQLAVSSVMWTVSGWASWYGPGFHGNYSASGEVFNQEAMTAAHRTLPFGTRVRVTNIDNGRSVIVRINDRGPFHGDRVIDLSAGAARVIGLVSSGVAPVRLEVLGSLQTAKR